LLHVEAVTFTGHDGHRLTGRLHLPKAPVGAILLAHCFTCSKEQLTTARVAKGLAAAGYAVLRFDFAGLGDSEGDFAATSIATNVDDVVAAAGLLVERVPGPSGLAGHSLGGAAVLLAARRLPGVGSVAVMGTPSSADHVRRLVGDRALRDLATQGRATITVGGRPFQLGGDFLADLDQVAGADLTAGFTRPLCVVHGLEDEVVDVSQAETLFARAGQPKQFAAIPGADHLFRQRVHSDQLVRVLADWFDRTLVGR